MLSMSLSVSDLCASDAQCQPKSSRDSLELQSFQGREAPFDPRGEPSFYTELSTSPEAYGHSLKIDPTEDFQHANEFFVLTDKPELVNIMTDRDLQPFSNFWCPKDAIIFKGSGILKMSPYF